MSVSSMAATALSNLSYQRQEELANLRAGNIQQAAASKIVADTRQEEKLAYTRAAANIVKYVNRANTVFAVLAKNKNIDLPQMVDVTA